MNFVQILRNVGKNGKKKFPHFFYSNTFFFFIVMMLKSLMLKVFVKVVKHFKNLLVELKGKNPKKTKNSEFFFFNFINRSLVQAFISIATQTNNESEAHNLIANTLLNKISVPMKNLADTQLKARKPVNKKRK